jgi:hypothetical protein
MRRRGKPPCRRITGSTRSRGRRSTRRTTGGKPPRRRITGSMSSRRSTRRRATGASKPPRRRIWRTKGSTESRACNRHRRRGSPGGARRVSWPSRGACPMASSPGQKLEEQGASSLGRRAPCHAHSLSKVRRAPLENTGSRSDPAKYRPN